MGTEIDVSGKSKTVMDVSRGVVEVGKSRRLSKEELGNCESNREDDMFHREVPQVARGCSVADKRNAEDFEVDVVGNTEGEEGVESVVDRESQDETECSSSFGCTDSGSGNDEVSGDMEVESHMQDDNAVLMEFDGDGDLFRTRKKKLTDKWRKFVHPLMWRCKWVELKVRELQSQAAKYDKELAECEKRKHCELEKPSLEDHAIKSAPFINHNRSIKLMKRKKRKRAEETTDLASYTACHSVFSHFVSKKSGDDAAHVDAGDCHAGKTPLGSGEFDLDSELPSLQVKDSDAFESILRKIEEAQLHVRQLRMRMDKLVQENAEKCAADFPSFAPHDQSTSSDPNSLPPHVNNVSARLGSMPSTSQLPSKKLALPGTVASAAGLIPRDIIKSSDDPSTARKRVKTENDILIYKRRMKVESDDTSEDVQTQPEPEGKLEMGVHVADTNRPRRLKTAQEQSSTAKTQSPSKATTPKNKNKRGRRKARTGRWSKRSSG